MPISLRVRATRIAISPRLAMRTFVNTAAQSIQAGGGEVSGVPLRKPASESLRGRLSQPLTSFLPGTPDTSPRGLRIGCAAVLIELQSHSTVSDGQLAPADVVAEAAKAGVTTLALTDHDAIAGVPEAAEAAKSLGIELVPAIEMSCVHEYAEDLHICGYWVDLGRIAPACERAQHERVARAGEIIENLRREGFDIHLEDAVREAGDALSIGRPHIARAAGATGDLGPFFEEYLVPGAKAFVPRRWPTAEQAVETIKPAGGIAVVAPPYWDISAPAEVDELIRALDVDGVETFYPTHSEEQTKHLLELCEELDLIPTASSDYHGPTHKTFAAFGAYDTYGLAEPQVPRL